MAWSWVKNVLGIASNAEPASIPRRNDLCWCGSGLKYKRCHLERDLDRARGARRTACATT